MGSEDSSARTLRIDAAELAADAATLDALARLQLTACRCGFPVLPVLADRPCFVVNSRTS